MVEERWIGNKWVNECWLMVANYFLEGHFIWVHFHPIKSMIFSINIKFRIKWTVICFPNGHQSKRESRAFWKPRNNINHVWSQIFYTKKCMQVGSLFLEYFTYIYIDSHLNFLIYTYLLIIIYTYLFILISSLIYYMNLINLLKYCMENIETPTKFSKLASIFLAT